jgi:hypothetical protein
MARSRTERIVRVSHQHSYLREPRLAVAASILEHASTVIEDAVVSIACERQGTWQLVELRQTAVAGRRFDTEIAWSVADTDTPFERDGVLVAPFSAVLGHALLIVECRAGKPIADDLRRTVQRVLDAGGVAFDRVFAAEREGHAAYR